MKNDGVAPVGTSSAGMFLVTTGRWRFGPQDVPTAKSTLDPRTGIPHSDKITGSYGT